jgi:hypothetical protein
VSSGENGVTVTEGTQVNLGARAGAGTDGVLAHKNIEGSNSPVKLGLGLAETSPNLRFCSSYHCRCMFILTYHHDKLLIGMYHFIL